MVLSQCLIGFSLPFRRNLLDEYPEDPDYTPLMEDRPGGFNWGAAGAPQVNNNAGGTGAPERGAGAAADADLPNNVNNNNNNQ